MAKIQTIFDQMNEEKRIERSYVRLGMKEFEFLRFFSTFVAFIMNFLFIYAYYYTYDYTEEGNEAKMEKEKLFGAKISDIIFFLKINQMFTSICSLLIFLKNRSHIIYLDFWRKRFHQLKPTAKAQKGKTTQTQSKMNQRSG